MVVLAEGTAMEIKDAETVCDPEPGRHGSISINLKLGLRRDRALYESLAPHGDLINWHAQRDGNNRRKKTPQVVPDRAALDISAEEFDSGSETVCISGRSLEESGVGQGWHLARGWLELTGFSSAACGTSR